MPSRPRQIPLVGRVSAAAVTALVCAGLILTIGVWHLSRTREAAFEGARSDVRNLSRSLAGHATGLIDGINLTLTGMAERADGADPEALTAFVRRRAHGLRQVRRLSVLDAAGNRVADSMTGPGPYAETGAAQDNFRWHRDNPDADLRVGLPVSDAGRAGTIIPVSRRIGGPDGRFGGIVSAALDPGVLRGVYDDVVLGERGAVALWRDDGRLLVRRPALPEGMDRDFSQTPFFRALRTAPDAGPNLTDLPGATDGIRRIFGVERLTRYPSLLVSVGVSVDDVAAAWRREAQIEAAVFGLAALTLIGLGIGLDRHERRSRAAEREAGEAESLFRALFDHATDTLFVHRIEPDGCIRVEALNDAAARLLGRPAHALAGRPLDEILPQHRFEQVRAELGETARRGTPLAFEVRDEAGEAPRVWEVVHVPLRDHAGRIARIFAGAREISHLRAAETAALDANRLLVLAEQMAQVGHWHLDLASNRLTWSDEVYRIYGRDPATFRPTLEEGIAAYHPDDRASVAAMVSEAVERRSSFEFMLRLVRPDGTIRHVQCRGICEFAASSGGEPAASGLFGVFFDITERLKAEASLVASEARYRLLADNASDLIVLGHADGRRSYISPAVTGMLGYTVEEAHAVGMRAWIHPEDIETVFRTTMALSDAVPTAKVVYRLRHKAGHYIWAEAAFRRVVGDPGDVRIVTAIRDVTERQRQARHLEAAKAQAEAGARIKAEFLANMSHELRTPLAGMLGTHDLLLGDASLTPAQSRLVGLAQEASRSLLTIVNDILDFSKIEAGELAIERVAFSLAALVESCRRLAAEAARGKPLAVTVAIEPDVPDWLEGDPTRLRQVLLNLATNAVKFTERGEVAITVSREGERDGSPLLRVGVRDTGIGIPSDTLPRLFERFSQADGSMARRFGGTGLGLAISKRLVGLMGGEIGVESRPGLGSTFWFVLPLALGSTERPAASPAILGAAPRALRILLAEDNRINQEIVTAVLERKGHAVTLAVDGRAAVAAVLDAGSPARFDVVLMDVQMPEMDGLEATAAIRAREAREGGARIPIVALTANAMSDEVERCRSAGTDAHVAKPVHWPDLFAVLDRLCVGAVEPAADVLDAAMLDTMAGVVGRDRIGDLLAASVREIERRVAVLSEPGIAETSFAAELGALLTLAEQLGFVELAVLCRDIERRPVDGVRRIDALHGAVARARAAVAGGAYARAA